MQNNVKYESSTSIGSNVLAKVKGFRNVDQRSRSRSQSHQYSCNRKGFYQLSIHPQYEVSISYSSNVLTKVNFFLPQSHSQTGQNQDIHKFHSAA